MCAVGRRHSRARSRRGSRWALAVWLAGASAAFATSGSAQDLAVATYTTADGLPQDVIARLLLDANGFLWIGGPSTLTRFDGEQFTVFGKAQGLDVGTGINALQLDARGHLWIGTNGAGIYRCDLTSAESGGRFTQYRVGSGRASNRVNAIALAADGRLWAGTDAGLYAGREGQPFERVTLPLERPRSQDTVQIAALALDDLGLWAGTSSATYRCAGGTCGAGPALSARSLLLDRDGALWIGGDQGLHVLHAEAGGYVAEPIASAKPLRVRQMSPASSGILAGTSDGEVVVVSGRVARVLPMALPLSLVNDVLEDAAQNLWLATMKGLVTVRRQGIALFSTRHGLRGTTISGVTRDRAGRIYAIEDENWIHQIDGGRLTAHHLRVPPGVGRTAWPRTTTIVDRAGEIWMGTANGLFRYPPFSASTSTGTESFPTHRYTKTDGLAGDEVTEVFEDSRGDLWIASARQNPATLTVWRRAAGKFDVVGADQGLPAFNQPMAFVEDASGAIWAGLREGGVVRVRDGRATIYGTETGFPALVTASVLDRRGHLWFGGNDALVRVEASGDAVRVIPALSDFGARVLSLEEASSGLLVVGTTNGLLSLDPGSGAVRRFSRFDGLPAGAIDALARNANGEILIVAGNALARWAPSAAVRFEPGIRCVLSGIRAAGADVRIQPAGVQQLEGIEIPAARNAIDIEFLALSRQLGEQLAYQYRLVGASDEWTVAPQRRASYAGLAAGRYTFEVRASAPGRGFVSDPARVGFTVLPPWYRQWWFLSASVTAALLLAYGAHRVRLGAALRSERLRSRIATDLHDDIGSSLSQIAILAEVAKRRGGADRPEVLEPLTSIAATSRDLVEAMSDIVWAVNPHTDSLSDLTHRMRRFAEETLGGAEIEHSFAGPPDDVDLRMGADLRRELYLILKESVNNIARHSGATWAGIDFTVTRRELRLVVSDDGAGFDPDGQFEGHGIASMRKRAAAFGGRLIIESRRGAGTGTTVTLAAPR